MNTDANFDPPQKDDPPDVVDEHAKAEIEKVHAETEKFMNRAKARKAHA